MEDTHLQVWRDEMADLDSSDAWLNWARRVEQSLGIDDLDGDMSTGTAADDTYCLDEAYAEFRKGKTVEQYAETVRARGPVANRKVA